MSSPLSPRRDLVDGAPEGGLVEGHGSPRLNGLAAHGPLAHIVHGKLRRRRRGSAARFGSGCPSVAGGRTSSAMASFVLGPTVSDQLFRRCGCWSEAAVCGCTTDASLGRRLASDARRDGASDKASASRADIMPFSLRPSIERSSSKSDGRRFDRLHGHIASSPPAVQRPAVPGCGRDIIEVESQGDALSVRA